MASIRELRGRIRSVGSIRQITRAMEMVATTKLRRFQDRATASRPYSQEIAGLVGRLANVLGESVENRPLFRRGAGEGTAVLLVTSDRGLCGAYNSNLFKKLEIWLAEQGGAPVTWYVIGRKGYQYLLRRGREVERYLVEPPLEKTDYRAAADTAKILTEAFLSGQFKDVVIVYTAFESVVRYVPTIVQLLPVEKTAAEGSEASGEVILEPDAETIFDKLVPRYVGTRVYNALLESLTSEYASRRVSMKNATDAARDMSKILKGIYNRKRQENITKELLDIVGGVEALR
jgi:F-type H+-transporting ATPase subunit gamma